MDKTQINYLNRDFPFVLAPIMKPLYVLQMARHKHWTREAQARNIYSYIEGCEESLNRAKALLDRIERQ